MPSRIVRDGILTSDPVNQLGWPAEIFYRRLMSVVDDFGRYDGRPSVLRAVLYPLKLDKVSESDVVKWTQEAAEAGLVRRYTVENKPFIEIVKFDQRVQQKRSKWPGPPDDPPQPTAVHGESPPILEASSETKRKTDTARKRATHLPEGFGISERVKAWAAEKGHGRLVERLEHFLSYAKRKAPTYADWDEALMTAIREDWAKLGGPSAPKAKITAPDCNVPGCKREGIPSLGGKCEVHHMQAKPLPGSPELARALGALLPPKPTRSAA